MRTAPRRLKIGTLPVDSVTQDEALDIVEGLVRDGAGGSVFTPNVDHVVLADEDAHLRDVYSRVTLSIADGMPIVWASRLLGVPLPERVAGSDFVPRLLSRAADRGWRIYFLGGAPGVGELARRKVLEQLPSAKVVGVEAPDVDFTKPPEARKGLVDAVRAASPDIVLVALGAPKQERLIDEMCAALRPAVMLGVGGTLDFLAGRIPRAPDWMARTGLEWLFRLGREPRRLYKRYLLRDPKFLLILARALGERMRDLPRGARGEARRE
jgi:N-acetylglucosaminyldiphosphoundecaprenol N-acetyl-beta-D-mannosaminyltransferase